MTTDQSPHVDRVDGEIVVDSTAEEPVIPAQRGAPAGQSAAPKSGEQKPILTPWMKDRAEFTGRHRQVGASGGLGRSETGWPILGRWTPHRRRIGVTASPRRSSGTVCGCTTDSR